MFDIYPNHNNGLYNAKSKRQQSPLRAYETEAKQQNQNNGYDYSSIFCDSLVRADFVQKIYTLLTIELLITIVLIVLGLYTEAQLGFVYTKNGIKLKFSGMGNSTYPNQGSPSLTGMFLATFFMSVFLHCILFCCGDFSKKGPISFTIVTFYVLFFGLMFTPLCILVAYYCGTAIVWQAWGTTFTTFFGLTLYVFNTKKDVTFQVGAIFIISPNFLALIILLSIWPGYAVNICLCCFFMIMYGFFLIWETQLIMGKGCSDNKWLRKFRLSNDDYVFGSLILYASFNQWFIAFCMSAIILFVALCVAMVAAIFKR